MEPTKKTEPRKLQLVPAPRDLTPPPGWIAWHDRFDAIDGLAPACQMRVMGFRACGNGAR